ncbi:uncharacterized protein LOC108674141 isoform X2 [Hyalella azteca]|uniref:Uncharacterized protein LOC108674141 isoform X2 n=1 Tax=Hyalella azteca TaxID=294128 RepID=A0A979FN74_HYAAZ|nr:uncharacterized protein LOC108674141 isoform X2 [Hyalella azteca]
MLTSLSDVKAHKTVQRLLAYFRMDLLLPVFQLLYFVAHFLVSVLQAVYGTYMDVLQITHFLYQKLTHTVHAQEQYNEGKGKLPEHPAVVFLPGHYLAAQLPQLVSLMTAFVKAGAKQITLYDPAGKIEEQQDELLLCLTRSLPGSLFLLLQHPLEQINEEPQKEQVF